MNAILKLFMSNSTWAKELGLFIIRVGIGLIFIRHGYPKIIAGTGEWKWLGAQMKSISIYFLPVMWGFAAACAEFFGGIALTLGLGTRIACVFMSFGMFIAFMHHLKKGDPWGYMSHPLALMVVLIGLLVAGSGKFSLDYYLR